MSIYEKPTVRLDEDDASYSFARLPLAGVYMRSDNNFWNQTEPISTISISIGSDLMETSVARKMTRNGGVGLAVHLGENPLHIRNAWHVASLRSVENHTPIVYSDTFAAKFGCFCSTGTKQPAVENINPPMQS
eukprot:Filipodium_phascolosomae@DN2061_c0_g1_i1.p1